MHLSSPRAAATPCAPYCRSHSLLLQQTKELVGGAERGEAARYVGLLGELRNLAEYRKVEIGDFEWGRDNEEEIEHRLAVDRLEFDSLAMAPIGEAEPVRHQGAAVGNGNASAHAGRPEALPPLDHPQQRLGGLIVEAEQADQLGEKLIL